MNRRSLAALCALPLLLAVRPARADGDVVVYTEGRLLDSSDHPVTGNVTLVFAVMKAEKAVEAAWTDTFALTLTDGIYAVALGDTTNGTNIALPASVFGGDRWLSIKIGDEELLPRLKLGSVPRAASADTLGGLALADLDARNDGRYAPVSGGGYVQLQAATPGTAQTGSLNLSGSVVAGKLVGDGTGITNAAAITLGGKSLTDLDGRYAPVSGGGYVQLQAATPGTAQTGSLNLSGTVTAGKFAGDGSALGGVALAGHNHDDRYVKLASAGTPLSVGDLASTGTVSATAFKIGDQSVLSFFDGVQRPCASGASIQTFSAASGTWSSCPNNWNCSATPSHPGCATSSQYHTCKEILADPAFNGSSGLYWINPYGPNSGIPPLQVYCEMVADGGGWTLVVRNNGGSWAHDDCNTVGTVTAMDQASTAKLSDATINALNATVYRLSCKSLITYWDALSRPFNACSQGGENKRGKNSLSDGYTNLSSDDNARGMAAGDNSVGSNMYYGYSSANTSTPGCHSAGWGGSGWMMAR